MGELYFRPANLSETNLIWEIILQAIKRRKEDKSDQWQDGYPNLKIIQKDIRKGEGYVLTDGKTVLGYCAIMINGEPSYSEIVGNWMTNGDFVVFHRIAISEKFLGQGLAQKMIQFIEKFALNNKIYSIKADTNFDNPAMLNIFEKLGFTFCGEVFFNGSPRKAYEKLLTPSL